MTARRWWMLSLIVVATAVLAPPVAAQPKTVNWDFVLNVGMTHPVAVMGKDFVDDVLKRTNGQLNIIMRPPGEMPYKLTEYLRVTGQGNAQMADVYMGFLAGDSKIAVLTGLPFLVGTPEELKKAMVVLDPLIREDFARFGADILTWFTWPEQNVYGRGKPIITLEDMKGRKIRTTSPEQSEMIKRLGGVPISLTAPEVPSADQRGGGGSRAPGAHAQGDTRPRVLGSSGPRATVQDQVPQGLARGRRPHAQDDGALLGRVGETGWPQAGRGAGRGEESAGPLARRWPRSPCRWRPACAACVRRPWLWPDSRPWS